MRSLQFDLRIPIQVFWLNLLNSGNKTEQSTRKTD